jgi:3-hydroxy acid dehydrogenase/malonic semialdehyde reductase
MNVLITGATAGFGRAFAKIFISNGHRVMATGRREEKLEELKAELGPKLFTANLDVQKKNEIKKVFENLPSEFSQIDILINNAGLALGLDLAQNAKLEDWDTMLDTNIKGLAYCTFFVLPSMVKQNSGHIINIGSVAGEYAYPGGNIYGASKAFVHHFSQNLRADLLGTKVRVTNIEPGLVSGTEFSNTRFKGDQTKVQKVYAGTESLNANDIAETVFWVATRPPHVNINVISLMPVTQASGPLAIFRTSM